MSHSDIQVQIQRAHCQSSRRLLPLKENVLARNETNCTQGVH